MTWIGSLKPWIEYIQGRNCEVTLLNMAKLAIPRHKELLAEVAEVLEDPGIREVPIDLGPKYRLMDVASGLYLISDDSRQAVALMKWGEEFLRPNLRELRFFTAADTGELDGLPRFPGKRFVVGVRFAHRFFTFFEPERPVRGGPAAEAGRNFYVGTVRDVFRSVDVAERPAPSRAADSGAGIYSWARFTENNPNANSLRPAK